MKILAFDTATPATAVALSGVAEVPIESRDDPPPGQRPGHVGRLLPLITQVLDRGGVSWEDLDRIAVGIGPGTFTGLRIGIATARALAAASRTPLVGVSTLQSMARAAEGRAREDGAGLVMAVLDARRGEAFAAVWSSATRQLCLRAAALTPASLGEWVRGAGQSSMAVGDGAIAFRGALESAGTFVPADGSELHAVRAAFHAEIARELAPADAEQVHPEYVRLPDAEIARRAAR